MMASPPHTREQNPDAYAQHQDDQEHENDRSCTHEGAPLRLETTPWLIGARRCRAESTWAVGRRQDFRFV